MKKTAVAVLIITSLFISMRSALAEVKKTNTETKGTAEKSVEPKEEVTSAAPQQVDEAGLEEARKKKEEELKKAKEALNKQEWTVYLMSLTDKQAKVKNDTLTFADGKVASKELSGKGYPQSNCTITIQEDGAIIWETMQSNELQDVAFWRGELKEGVMRGILSMHPKDGKNNQDFSFSTQASSVITEEKAGLKNSEEPQAPKVEQQKTEARKKKIRK